MDNTQHDEEWKKVPDFPNTLVSNYGRLRSLFRGGDKIRSLIIGSNGYVEVTLQCGRYKRRYKVHVLVAEHFLGSKPAGLDCNHIDGVKTNNHVSNLEYVTRSENLKHAFRLGLATSPFTGRKGETVYNSKLRDQDVIAMREQYAKGVTRRDLATQYKISYYTVWDITTRKSWTHIP